MVATLASGVGPLQGATEVTVQGGIATFTNLADNLAETITLDFSIPNTSFTAGPSSSIVVMPGYGIQLKIFAQPPSSVTAGVVLGTTVIYEEDSHGNVETGDNSTVITAAPMSSAVLQGTQATVKGGVATFASLVDDTAGTVQLLFTGGGLSSQASNPVTVTPAAPYQLLIKSEPPSSVTAGQAFGTVVWEADKFNNLETTDNSTQVSAKLGSGVGPLLGTTVVTMSGGVATFNDLIDDTAETITLDLSGGGLTGGPSNDVVVNPSTPASLVLKTQPSGSVQAGQSFGAVVWEEDQYHNRVTTDSSTQVTVALQSGVGVGPLQGSVKTVTLNDGMATFANLSDDLAETIALRFTSGMLSQLTSNNIVVSAAAAFEVGDLDGAVGVGDGWAGVWNAAGDPGRRRVREPGEE